MTKIEKIKLLCEEKLRVAESYKDENISYMNGVTDTCKEILKAICEVENDELRCEV